jgi:hypothetical protein
MKIAELFRRLNPNNTKDTSIDQGLKQSILSNLVGSSYDNGDVKNSITKLFLKDKVNNPFDSRQNYDYTGYMFDPNMKASLNLNDMSMHYPDKYKNINHPAYSYKFFPENFDWNNPQTRNFGMLMTGQP